MHSAEPGCLAACPADGAIVQYSNGIVDFQQNHCIGCGYCVNGCPFNIPKFDPATKKMFKCTLLLINSATFALKRATRAAAKSRQ